MEPGSFSVNASASDADGGIREVRLFAEVIHTTAVRSAARDWRAHRLR
jgi:hypothetical protein